MRNYRLIYELFLVFIAFRLIKSYMESKESYPTIKDFVIQEAHEKAFEKMVMGLK